MDGPIQNVFPTILNGFHTECFSLHTKWMAPYRMFYQCIKWMAPYRMIFHILNGWPHTECFSTYTKWMAPYRMIFHMY